VPTPQGLGRELMAIRIPAVLIASFFLPVLLVSSAKEN